MISSGTEQIHDINEICSAISHHMKGSNPYALFHFRVTHRCPEWIHPACLYQIWNDVGTKSVYGDIFKKMPVLQNSSVEDW